MGGDDNHDRVAQRAVAGDRAAQAAVDMAVDAAVTAGDYAEVDRWLRPIAAQARTDPQALELLLGLIDGNGIVRRTAARHVADDHLLDEACQDALVSIARHIGSFEGRSRVTTWIHPIASNAGRMATRAVGRRPDTVAAAALPDIDPGLRRMSSLVVSRDQIRQLVSELPEHQRVPLQLREYEGRSYGEIAEELDVSIGTVKSRISRAREELARRLDL